MNKNEKQVIKLKKKFFFVFDNPVLKNKIKKHFDKKGSFVVFIIALLLNKMNEKTIVNLLKINKDEWVELFSSLYDNQKIIDVYKQLDINPIIPLDQIISYFDLFDDFIDEFINLIKQHNINLNMNESTLKLIVKKSIGYLFYNCVNCSLDYEFKDILVDPDYDTKYQIILNNTKLFSNAKKLITDNCSDKINNLIEILLGVNNSLTK